MSRAHNADLFLPLLVLVAMAILEIWWAVRDVPRRKRLLAAGRTTDPSEPEVLAALSTLNEGSKDRLFHLSRHAVLPFRGHRVVLVWGDVGGFNVYKGGSEWRMMKLLYCLGDASEREWLVRQTDVLRETKRGRDYSVFWIRDLKQMEKDLDWSVRSRDRV